MRALLYRHIEVSSVGGNSYQERTGGGRREAQAHARLCGELPAPQALDNLFRRCLLDNAECASLLARARRDTAINAGPFPFLKYNASARLT